MTIHDPEALVRTLIQKPQESEWFEFKENYANPDGLGKYISALANAAIFEQRPAAYLILGVKDKTHEIIGTKVRLKNEKKGGEPLEFWLSKKINHNVGFEFIECDIDNMHVEIIYIRPTYQAPVKFNNIAYIRIGETTPHLSKYPQKEQKLWSITGKYKFENILVSEHVDQEYILDNFRVRDFLDKLGSLPTNHAAIIEKLLREKLITNNDQERYDIHMILALLCASDFSKYHMLERKGARLIVYDGTSKLHTKIDVHGNMGYSIGFNNLTNRILSHIPSKETITADGRSTHYDIPAVAIRELVANALIHQDFSIGGVGPVVEIFSDRIKITNPGIPLVETDRFIDSPSRSRNDKLTNFMRRLGFCEERGSGVDRAIKAIEDKGIPAPLFRTVSDSTVVTIFGPKPFRDMTKEDRIRACYQHASLKFEMNERMSNSSLRERFKLNDKQYPQVSRVIADTLEAKLIKPLSETQGKKNAKYIPIWA